MFSEFTNIQKSRLNAILKSILNCERITRIGLAERLALSPSSIAKYIKALMEMGLIRETDRKPSTGGRPSTFIEFNPDVGLNIAVVLDAAVMRGVLINAVGDIVAEHSLPTLLGIPKDDLLRRLLDLIDGLIDRARDSRKKIFGIGIGIGGHIDPEKGISREYLYAKDWYDVPLTELVVNRYGLPCFLVNDANACALGEKYYGLAMGVDHFLCVLLAEGIGMGIVVNGEIYLGSNHYAGEFGHTHALADGPLCFCGHNGCLETVSSKQFILARCADGLRQGVNSEILKFCGNRIESLQIEHIIRASNNGDRFARSIFDQVGKRMGDKLADIADIFNPQLIVLRGSVIDGNNFLFECIERVVMNQCLRPIAKSLSIAYSEETLDTRFMGINSMILIDYFSRQ